MRGVSSNSSKDLGPAGVVRPIQSGTLPMPILNDGECRRLELFPLRGGSHSAPSTPHHTSRNAMLAPTPPFMEWFTADRIVHLLARYRLKLAANRAEANQWNQMFPLANAEPKQHLPDIYPPRKEWHQFRRKRREALETSEVWAQALEYRMLLAIQRGESHPWARNLQIEIAAIREGGLQKTGFSFTAPRIHAVVDEFDSQKIRIISTFDYRDRVILSLTSQYWSLLVDPFLNASSVAFRRDRGRNAPAALHELQQLNLSRPSTPLWVGECDIRSFFDVLHHDLVIESLHLMMKRMAAARIAVDPRAMELVHSYLDCYSFPKSVLPVLPVAGKKWPLEALQEFYLSPLKEPLGIPQGGALSNILINVVLDRADRALESFRQKSGNEVTYWRYCDDSLIITQDRQTCTEAFATYLSSLHSLRLPIHPPTPLPTYVAPNKAIFWNAKSRPPYAWCAGKFPWIGFLGFQFRYDGLARLRPRSVKKVHFKMSVLARQLSRPANAKFPPDDPSTLTTPERLIRFYKNKVMASAFGRQWFQSPRSSQLCWFGWASQLKRWPHQTHFLKNLDKHFGGVVTKLRFSLADNSSEIRSRRDFRPWSFFLNFSRRASSKRKMPPRGIS